jgi:hypothetical protein
MVAKVHTPAKKVHRLSGRTKADLFIVESMNLDDEPDGFCEGEVLQRIHSLCKKDADYRYIRTRQELVVMAKQFRRSGKRYLHIACHGNDEYLFTTLDPLPFADLGSILRPAVKDRRLFVSACEAVNDDLADAIMRPGGCRSIVGSTVGIRYDVAAVMWASFYQLMFEANPKAMSTSDIRATLMKLAATFDVEMRFITRTSTDRCWEDVAL